MDPRFDKIDILDVRKTEWDLENIRLFVERLFKNIEMFCLL